VRILVVGKQGMLAQELGKSFSEAGFEVVCKGRSEIDVCQPQMVQNALLHDQPSVIINAAGYTAVDQAESEPDQAFAVNRDGAQCLAKHASRLGIPLIHISTDYVFDGTSRRPYREDDQASPLGVYGHSKWEGEEAIRRSQPQHIILRTAWLYSIYGRNFLKTILRKGMDGQALRIVNDQWGCPTWAKDVAEVLVAIVYKISDEITVPWGTYHFCGTGEATWYEFAQAIIKHGQDLSPFSANSVTPISSEDYLALAKRPAYSVLDCSKIQHTLGLKSSPWQASVQHCVKELVACPDLLHARS
jgi:dTDP-4-dehydrorhamnose reductase